MFVFYELEVVPLARFSPFVDRQILLSSNSVELSSEVWTTSSAKVDTIVSYSLVGS